MRKVLELPNMAVTSGVADSTKGNKSGPQLELRASSHRLDRSRGHPERSVRKLSCRLSQLTAHSTSPFVWGSTAAKYGNLLHATACGFKLKLVGMWVCDSQSMVG